MEIIEEYLDEPDDDERLFILEKSGKLIKTKMVLKRQMMRVNIELKMEFIFLHREL